MKESIVRIIHRYFLQESQLASSLRNAGWMVFDRVLRGALTVFVGSWVARYLEPGLYGTLSFAIALTTFFQAICNLGLDNLVVRAVIAREAPDGQILGTTLVMRLAIGLICWGALTTYFWVTPDTNKNSLIVGVIVSASLIFQAGNTIDLWFISQMQSRRTAVAKILAYGVSYGLRIVFILTHRNITWFAAAILCDYVVSAALMMILYRGYTSTSKWSVSWGLVKEMVRESWYYMVSGVAVITYMQIDQIYLGILRGKFELGIYSAVIRFASVWYFLPATLCTSFMPVVVRKKVEGSDAYLGALRKLYVGFFALSAFITAGLMGFAGPIIRLLLGPAYAHSESTLAIYALSIIPVFLGNAHNLWMINDRLPKMMLGRTVLGGVVALVAGYVLIVKLGLIGAAIGAVLGYAASDIIAPLILRPRFVVALLRG